MPGITDAQLLEHAHRSKDKVVLITGGANGIGKAAVLEFAKAGAIIVIGDREEDTAQKAVQEIRKTFSIEAMSYKCDVTSWEDQLALFQAAIVKYGRIDIVVANAGITERGGFSLPGTSGVPQKPDLTTLEVNLIGVLYTTRLALFYLGQNPSPSKSLVLIGSIASLAGLPLAPLYTVSKHGIIGLLRSLVGEGRQDIRINVISPWFTDTRILQPATRVILAGLPFTRLSAVVGAIVLAATDPDFSTNGAIFTIPDQGEVFRIDAKDVNIYDSGMYKLLADRINTMRTLGGLARLSLALKQSSMSIRIALLAVCCAAGYAILSKGV